MPVSQNGYFANDRSLITTIDIPGGRLAVRKDYGIPVIFKYVAEQFHNRVEPLKWPGNWGYAERPIRGGRTLSNHASGTAIDLNAPQHPLGTSPYANFSSRQISEIRKILDECDGVIRWGGDYSGRKDGMHFEINKDEDSCRRLAAKLAGRTPDPKPAPTPAETTKKGILGMTDRIDHKRRKRQDFAGDFSAQHMRINDDGDYSIVTGPCDFGVTIKFDIVGLKPGEYAYVYLAECMYKSGEPTTVSRELAIETVHKNDAFSITGLWGLFDEWKGRSPRARLIVKTKAKNAGIENIVISGLHS